eukprot:5552677-Ditylum_brightwellii.AAC.1
MACHSFVVAVTLVAINVRCTAVAVIVRSIGKGVHLVIAFFIAAVFDLKVTEVIKGGGYFGVDKSIQVLVGYLIRSAMSHVSFCALSTML